MFLFHSKKTWCRPPGEWGSLYSGLDVSNCIVGRKSTVNDDIDGDGDDDGWKVMIQGRFEWYMQEGFKPSRKLRSSTSKCSTWGCPCSCILSNTIQYYAILSMPILSHTIQYYLILSISILSQTIQPSYIILYYIILLSSIHCPCIHPHYKMERFRLSFHTRLGCMAGTWMITHL